MATQTTYTIGITFQHTAQSRTAAGNLHLAVNHQSLAGGGCAYANVAILQDC